MSVGNESVTFSVVAWPLAPSRTRVWLRAGTLAVAGTFLLAISAKVQIPFWPVPQTLQTLVILLLGMTYGMRLGASTVALYLGSGALGVPVFAQGAGLAYFSGPTGGYLVGFLLAAILMGYFGDRGWGRRIGTMVLPMLAGTVVIFACGVGWLAYLIGWQKALAGGLYPFIFAANLKIAMAAFLLPTAWRFLGKNVS